MPWSSSRRVCSTSLQRSGSDVRRSLWRSARNWRCLETRVSAKGAVPSSGGILLSCRPRLGSQGIVKVDRAMSESSQRSQAIESCGRGQLQCHTARCGGCGSNYFFCPVLCHVGYCRQRGRRRSLRRWRTLRLSMRTGSAGRRWRRSSSARSRLNVKLRQGACHDRNGMSRGRTTIVFHGA